MLSIGKLAAGQAKYYLEQAEVRVDVVDSVGGLEEYYVGGHEARGVWVGRQLLAWGWGKVSKRRDCDACSAVSIRGTGLRSVGR